MLTGQLPFTADSMTGLMQQIAEAPHPPLRAFRPDLPACVESVIDRALAKNPDARYDSGPICRSSGRLSVANTEWTAMIGQSP